MNKKLYICHTIYHLYIVLIKHLDKQEPIDLVLSTTIPEVYMYKEKLMNLNFINSVYIIEENNIELSNQQNIVNKIKYRYQLCQYMTESLKLIWPTYNYIYIFNDNNEIGQYLSFKGIKYHLIEDGLDVFKTLTNMCDLSPSFRQKIFSFLRLNILSFGQSYYVQSIEVNDITNLNNKKFVEVNRDTLVKGLSVESKNILFNFFEGNTVNLYVDKKTVLILTQPFFLDKLLPTIEKQLLLYEKLIKKYQNKGYHVILKPHPRDTLNYREIMLSKEDILPPNMPIEILNFKEGFTLDTVLSVSSTAVDGVTFAQNRVQLGWDYLDQVK